MSDPDNTTEGDDVEDPFSESYDVEGTQVVTTDDDISVQDLLETIKESTRPPPTGTEQLLANELAIGMLNPPLEKIRHICEAAMTIKPEELKDYDMETEIQEVIKVHTLCLAFASHHQTIEWDDANNEMPMVKVALPFNETEAAYYLLPWTTKLHFESYIIEGSQTQRSLARVRKRYIKLFQDKSLENLDTEVLLEIKATFMFWLLRDGFKVANYRMVQSAFIAWAMPKATQWLNSIMARISPESFKEALSSLSGSGSLSQSRIRSSRTR